MKGQRSSHNDILVQPQNRVNVIVSGILPSVDLDDKVLGEGIACVADSQTATSDEDRIRSYVVVNGCLLYTSPSPRDQRGSRMPSSA